VRGKKKDAGCFPLRGVWRRNPRLRGRASEEAYILREKKIQGGATFQGKSIETFPRRRREEIDFKIPDVVASRGEEGGEGLLQKIFYSVTSGMGS